MRVYIDSFICSFVSFMVFLAVFNYFKIDYPYHIIFAFILSIIAFVLFFIFKNKNFKKFNLSLKEQKQIMLLADHLILKPRQEALTDFYFYLQKAGYMPKKCKNYILLSEQKTYVYLLFKFEKIKKDDLLPYLKNTPKGYKTVIICTPTQDESTLLSNLLQDRLKLIDIEKVYNFLKQQNLLPKLEETLTPKKVKFKILLKECFNRKKCKHFFYVGVIMLIFSLFVFYPKYYLILGCLFCIYGLICLFYGKKTN